MMKTVALIALFTGMAASIAAIILQTGKIARTGTADKKTKGMLLFAILFTLFSAFNIYLTFKYF